jgi:hypothetical protein
MVNNNNHINGAERFDSQVQNGAAAAKLWVDNSVVLAGCL